VPVEFFDQPDPAFGNFLGEFPYALLDRHPNGRHLAMQVRVWRDGAVDRAAVWDAHTKRVAWAPDGVLALCWLPGGRELLLVRDRVPKPHLMDVGFFRGERPERARHMRTVERFSWPDDVTREEPRALDAAPMPLAAGEAWAIVPSPTEALAAVTWLDQSEAGVELVSWADGAPLTHLSGRGHFGDRSNTLNTPTFSQDGQYLVLIYGAPQWWTGEDDDPDEPSPGGTFCCGWAVVGDVAQGTYTEYAVEVTVPSGWVPEDPHNAEWDYLPPAEFAGSKEFVVPLPTGGSWRFHVIAGPLD
jgi:hypothetical protein